MRGVYVKKMSIYTTRRNILKFMVYVFLFIFIAIAVYPVILIYFSGLKTNQEIATNTMGIPLKPQISNWVTAWYGGHFNRYTWNTFMVVIPIVVILLFLATLIGYALAFLPMYGKKYIFYILIIGIMIPIHSIIIPLFFLLRDLKLIDTRLGFILSYTAWAIGFDSFFMRMFFLGLPTELLDSAKIDGCNSWQSLWKIIVPISWPAITSLMIFRFLWTWNELFLPLMILNEEKVRVISLGLVLYKGHYQSDYSLIAAGASIAALPIIVLYLIFQRQFVKGVTAGALKQ